MSLNRAQRSAVTVLPEEVGSQLGRGLPDAVTRKSLLAFLGVPAAMRRGQKASLPE